MFYCIGYHLFDLNLFFFAFVFFLVYWCVRCQDLRFVVTKLRSLDHLHYEVGFYGEISVFHAPNGLLEYLCEPTDEVEPYKFSYLISKGHEVKVFLLEEGGNDMLLLLYFISSTFEITSNSLMCSFSSVQ